MTSSIICEASLVFCALQDDRLPADADEFPDRPRFHRRHSAADALCVTRPQARQSRFPSWDPARGAPDGIIVLGASIEADISAAHGTPVVRTAPDRIIAAAALALRYPNARVVFTGGSANLLSNDAREADFAGEVFEGLGIARSRLTMERRSRNTQENAEFSKALVNPKPGERWLLVTSGYHMPRSVGLFRKAGFPIEAYPVDWRVGGRDGLFAFSNRALEGLWRTDAGVREWMGLIAYRATGKIDELLPGPVPN
jgi:uncharacterized SAM-binding protein YcdF (DUF218 family)